MRGYRGAAGDFAELVGALSCVRARSEDAAPASHRRPRLNEFFCGAGVVSAFRGRGRALVQTSLVGNECKKGVGSPNRSRQRFDRGESTWLDAHYWLS
jgi:hypothetical protein